MALSGSFTTNKYTTSSHGDIGLRLSWTATQSIENNTSTIKWTLKSYGSMSSGYNVQAGPVTVKINGTTVLNTTSRFKMYGDGKYSKSGDLFSIGQLHRLLEPDAGQNKPLCLNHRNGELHG